MKTMHNTLRATWAALMLAAAVLFVTNTTDGVAQQCCHVNIENTSACVAEICVTTGAGTICNFVAGGGIGAIGIPCGANPLVTVTDACGIKTVIPLGGCISPVRLPGGCCVQVCLQKNANNCWTVRITPVAGACNC